MIYFIGGLRQREFKYFTLIEKIRNENKGIEESFYDGDIKEETEKFMEKVSFNSIFSEQELIVLKRGEKLKDIERVLDYISNLDLTNKEIIIDYEKEDGKIPVKLNKKLELLRKEKKMEVYPFLKESGEEMKKYIQNELGISPKDALILLEMTGTDPFKIKNELEKIKIYLNGEKLDKNKVKKIISVEKEYKIYEMTERIFIGKSEEVLNYLEKSKEYMGILYSLYNELEIMYKLSSFMKEEKKFSTSYNVFKNQFEEIKEAFKAGNRLPNPYSIFKKLERLKSYSYESLAKLVYRCWEIEKEIKTGKMEMESAVEVFIMEIFSCFQKDAEFVRKN